MKWKPSAPLKGYTSETTKLKWGYIGIMEKKMETTIVYWGSTGVYRVWGFRVYGPIMENQMEKKMEDEMETGIM